MYHLVLLYHVLERHLCGPKTCSCDALVFVAQVVVAELMELDGLYFFVPLTKCLVLRHHTCIVLLRDGSNTMNF